MNSRRIIRPATWLSAALATLGVPFAANAGWFDTDCGPAPKWSSYVPNEGHLEIFEMSGKRYVFTGFKWTAAKNLAWFDTQDFPTLEVESVVDGYGEKVVGLNLAPDEPIFINYSVMPCRYMDTPITDEFPTLTEGSACAGYFVHDKLYYSLAMFEPPEDPDLAAEGDLLAFRFQAGRWVPWHPAVILNPLSGGTLHCSSQAQSAAEDMEDYGSAHWCTAACETDNPGNSGTYIILGKDKPEFVGEKFQLPICADWAFDSTTDMSSYKLCAAESEACPSGTGLYCGKPSLDQEPGMLYYCDGGEYDEVELCKVGCVSAPPGENDYCSGEQGACPSGDGLYCGESVGLTAAKLYQCVDGIYADVQICINGCVNAGPGNDDYCGSGDMCPNGDGLYCGESVDLNSGTLYLCEDGGYSVSMVCPDGCFDAGPGDNDYCNDAPCQCNSGECCDGCYFRPSTHVCDPEVDLQYGCIGGGCGADVGMQTRDRHCSGGSAACDGPLGNWSSQSPYANCSLSQTCSVGDNTCNDDANCMACADTYTITDYKCNAFTSANGLGPGGGEIIEVCGLVDTQGKVTVKARKYDGTDFSDRPYQVRVSPPQDAPCGPDTYIYKISNVVQPDGIETSELTFEFDSMWEQDQWDKGYCVTASTKPGDIGYDGSDQQKSWWYSDKFTLERTCN